MALNTWVSGVPTTIVGAEMNSLANNTIITGAQYANSLGYITCECKFEGKYTVAPTANTAISVWFLRAFDGINFEDGSGSVTSARFPDIVFGVQASTGQQKQIKRTVLPPGPFIPAVKNDATGQTLTTGSIVLVPETISIS